MFHVVFRDLLRAILGFLSFVQVGKGSSPHVS